MNQTWLQTSVILLALAASAPAYARDGAKQSEAREASTTSPAASDRRVSATPADGGMAAVANNAGPGQPGDGWQYFSDVVAGRAVVISPQGDYHLSQGKGLKLIVAQTARS